MAPDEDVLARLVRKTLYIGVFAFIIGNFNNLAQIIYNSFSGLGLKAGGGTITAAQLLQPGKLAQVGIDAGKPILTSISGLMGFTSFFDNFIQIAILLIAWLIVIISFFVMAIQVFVSLIEFKLTTLAGFVLVPFGLFGRTAFLAKVRSILADPVVLRQNWLDAYNYVTDKGAFALNDDARTNDPFSKVGKTQIAVEIG